MGRGRAGQAASQQDPREGMGVARLPWPDPWSRPSADGWAPNFQANSISTALAALIQVAVYNRCAVLPQPMMAVRRNLLPASAVTPRWRRVPAGAHQRPSGPDRNGVTGSGQCR